MTDPKPTIVVRQPDEAWYRQEDLADVSFFRANRESILSAIAAGRIVPRTDWMVDDRANDAARAAHKARKDGQR